MRLNAITASVLLGLILVTSAGAVPSGSIIQISHKLKMASSDPVPEKDYFIDVGSRSGIKPGDTFDIFRKVTAVNVSSGEAAELFQVPFGEMKVFVVGEYASVARITKAPEFKDIPVMKYNGVMLGDEVRLKSSLPFQPPTP